MPSGTPRQAAALEHRGLDGREIDSGTDRVVMSGRLDDWDFLLGEIAFEANHTDDRRLERRLDTLVALLDEAIRRSGR